MRWTRSILDWNLGSDQAYWDPMPWIARLEGKKLTPESVPVRRTSEIFRGRWEERNWRNVPGPVYGAMTDNCWVGRLSAPRHVLCGDDLDFDQEFLYRQPKTLRELLEVLDGAQQDPFAGWACDGDEHWTADLVRDWWHDRARVQDWIVRKAAEWSQGGVTNQEDDAVVGLRDFATYIDGELELDLRKYCFWLDNRLPPRVDDSLPLLSR